MLPIYNQQIFPKKISLGKNETDYTSSRPSLMKHKTRVENQKWPRTS